MIEVFKWIKGINKGNIDQVLEFSSQDMTRGNGYKLEKLRFRTDIVRYWFTNRVVNDWNRLGRHVISAESIGSFKRRLDQSMDRMTGGMAKYWIIPRVGDKELPRVGH